MDMKQIKELIASMEKAGLKRIKIKEEKGFELELESRSDHPAPHPHREPAPHFAPPPVASAPPHRPHEEPSKPEAAGECITSPMVGTFYSAPSPDDPLFVKVGDEVDENTVVCIIEAMKVMNEVKAGKKGKIVEALVNNGEPVEFGTKLFRIV